jgi:hypothetical protein
MNQIRLLVLFALVAVSVCVAQDQGSATVGNTQSTSVSPEGQGQPAAIRILAPVVGQTLTSNSVDLRFELVQPSRSGEPNFLVQIDSADPVSTSSTEYAFPELLPGTHIIQVTLVDANNSPIQGGSATVQFEVPSAPQPAHSDGSRGAKPHSLRTIAGSAPAAPIPPELRNDGDLNLPLAGSPLPVLSLIGFGLLIGGAAQAMRKR